MKPMTKRTWRNEFLAFALALMSVNVAIGQNTETTQKRSFENTRTEVDSQPTNSGTSPRGSSKTPPNGWLVIPDCFAAVDNSIELCAEETGRLLSLDVKLNQSVHANAIVGKLDSALAEVELKTAKLQHTFALDLAKDTSDVDYNKLAVKEAEHELANYRSIGKSVSESEISRLTLALGRAQLALQRSQQTQARAKVDAELRAAAVEASQQRVERCVLRSPHNGVITEVLKRPGQWIRVGDPIVRLADMENLVVDSLVELDRIDITKIIGAQVQVESTGQRQVDVRLPGMITSYDHEVSKRGLVRLHAKVLNQQIGGHWKLLPGQNVTLYIATSSEAKEQYISSPSQK